MRIENLGAIDIGDWLIRVESMGLVQIPEGGAEIVLLCVEQGALAKNGIRKILPFRRFILVEAESLAPAGLFRRKSEVLRIIGDRLLDITAVLIERGASIASITVFGIQFQESAPAGDGRVALTACLCFRGIAGQPSNLRLIAASGSHEGQQEVYGKETHPPANHNVLVSCRNDG